jgi:anti-sigma factor RsiW
MHRAEDDDRCLLYHSGELVPEERAAFEIELARCAVCWELLDSLRRASLFAAEAAVRPPSGLAERAAERALGGREEGPRFPAVRSIGFALAFAALAAAVYVFGPKRAGGKSLKWTNGLDRDILQAETDLQKISREIAVGTDPAEIDAEFRGLEESTKEMKRQL